jgi:hypothetical protein
MSVFRQSLLGDVNKSMKLEVPLGKRRECQIILGFVNFFFFGIGTIIAGLIDNSLSDCIIGGLQFFLPVVGSFVGCDHAAWSLSRCEYNRNRAVTCNTIL